MGADLYLEMQREAPRLLEQTSRQLNEAIRRMEWTLDLLSRQPKRGRGSKGRANIERVLREFVEQVKGKVE